MRDLLSLGAVSALFLFGLGCSSGAPDLEREEGEGLNLVFVLADQWRGTALGFLGKEKVLTPNLDALARESVVFTEAVSNYPVCSPYRGMLMTGQWPFKNGVYSNCNSRTAPFDCELGEGARCWSDVLKGKGYDLGYIGKWHLEAPRRPFVKSYNNRPKFAWNEWTPKNRRHGFDYWYAYNTFDRHMHPEYWDSNMSRDQRIKIDKWGPEHETDLAIRWLRNSDGKLRDSKKPFALVVSMNPPHMPYKQVPKRYVERYRGISNEELIGKRPDLAPPDTKMGKYTRRNWRYQYAMMTGVDDQVGRILHCLDEQGLTKNTLVVFTSDHGDCIGLQKHVGKNVHFEIAMRVPLIMRLPGLLKPRMDPLMLSTPDLYPTMLGLLGHAASNPREVEGRDFTTQLTRGVGDTPDSQLYLWLPPDGPRGGRRGIRTRRYTLMLERKEDGSERAVLRDRKLDPFQMRDFAKTRPRLVAELRKKLLPMLQAIGDTWPADSKAQ